MGMLSPDSFPEQANRVFLFHLARELGMTVCELEERMDAHELMEWSKYFAALRLKQQEDARKR